MEPSSSSSLGEGIPAAELRAIRSLIWDSVAARVKTVERDEVARALGDLVAKNAELFEEANMLGQIVVDLDRDIGTHAAGRQLLHTPARTLLERELRRMLEVERISGAAGEGADDRMSPRERAVADYLMMQPGDGSRPSSARPSTAGGAGGAWGNARKLLRQVDSKLNVFEIDAVAPAIRAALRREHDALLEDIDFLQEYLQGKSAEVQAAEMPPPTLSDLKDFGRKLETEGQMRRLLGAAPPPLEVAGPPERERASAAGIPRPTPPQAPQKPAPPRKRNPQPPPGRRPRPGMGGAGGRATPAGGGMQAPSRDGPKHVNRLRGMVLQCRGGNNV